MVPIINTNTHNIPFDIALIDQRGWHSHKECPPRVCVFTYCNNRSPTRCYYLKFGKYNILWTKLPNKVAQSYPKKHHSWHKRNWACGHHTTSTESTHTQYQNTQINGIILSKLHRIPNSHHTKQKKN